MNKIPNEISEHGTPADKAIWEISNKLRGKREKASPIDDRTNMKPAEIFGILDAVIVHKDGTIKYVF